MREAKNFKSRRAFLNYKLHAYSITICGDKSVLEQAVFDKLTARGLSKEDIKSVSVLQLTDEEAEQLYNELGGANKRVQANIKKAKEFTGGNNEMTYRQRNMIIKLCRYKYNWTPGATFSYILESCPKLRSKLTDFEIQKTKIGALYKIMKVEDADKVIKRLTQLEKNNNQTERNYK